MSSRPRPSSTDHSRISIEHHQPSMEPIQRYGAFPAQANPDELSNGSPSPIPSRRADPGLSSSPLHAPAEPHKLPRGSPSYMRSPLPNPTHMINHPHLLNSTNHPATPHFTPSRQADPYGSPSMPSRQTNPYRHGSLPSLADPDKLPISSLSYSPSRQGDSYRYTPSPAPAELYESPSSPPPFTSFRQADPYGSLPNGPPPFTPSMQANPYQYGPPPGPHKLPRGALSSILSGVAASYRYSSSPVPTEPYEPPYNPPPFTSFRQADLYGSLPNSSPPSTPSRPANYYRYGSPSTPAEPYELPRSSPPFTPSRQAPPPPRPPGRRLKKAEKRKRKGRPSRMAAEYHSLSEEFIQELCGVPLDQTDPTLMSGPPTDGETSDESPGESPRMTSTDITVMQTQKRRGSVSSIKSNEPVLTPVLPPLDLGPKPGSLPDESTPDSFPVTPDLVVTGQPKDKPAASVPGSACERLIKRAFASNEFSSLIETANKDERDTIHSLRGNDAQTFIDVIDGALDNLDLSVGTRRKCLRWLGRVCDDNAFLPKTLKISICYDRTSGVSYKGRFADVWKGEYCGRDVAVRILNSTWSDSDQQITGRFCKEIVMWKFFQHPNILPPIGVTMCEIQFAMASDWMVNGDINDFVKARPNIDRLGLLIGVAKGLIYIHDQQMIHGDLRGANIFIDQTGNARLANFSLLTIVTDYTKKSFSSSYIEDGVTRWMGPELINPELSGLKDNLPTKHSDCYALGMVIYETISGKLPFHQHADSTVFTKVLAGERPSREAGFADSLWEMLEKCWKPQPNDRPKIKDVLRCLEEISNS